MITLRRKEAVTEDLDRILNTDFYKAVYEKELGKKDPLNHFSLNIRQLNYDPSPDLSISEIASKNSDLTIESLYDRLISDHSFRQSSRSISHSVFDYFNIEPSKTLRKDLRYLADVVDEEFYYSTYPDVADSWLPAYIHYGLFGAAEGRKPAAYFDTKFYAANNPDIVTTSINPFVHYCRSGKDEGRQATDPKQEAQAAAHKLFVEQRSKFDSKHYLANNPDVEDSGMDPYVHYIAFGEREGRSPNPYFDPSFYFGLNADVRRAGKSAFEHYVESGIHEGRRGMPTESSYRSQEKKPLLFVGHDGIQAGSEVVLLEVIRWFYKHTNRQLKVLLLNPGPLADQYAEFAEVYVIADFHIDDKALFSKHINKHFEFIYVNTVVSGEFFSLLRDNDVQLNGDVVTHIHEMEKILAEHPEQMQELLGATDHWISASPSTTSALVSCYNIEHSNISTVEAFIQPTNDYHSDVEEAKFAARAALNISRDAFVVGGCGTVYWRKGPDIFLDAARQTLAQTELPIEFFWIGPGPDLDGIRSELTDEESKRIQFIGSKPNSSELIAAADVFFLSSREDPFPLVVMEAAQYAIPTICFSETTGITRFIGDDAGICLNAISSELAATEILNLAANRSKIEKLGKVARERVFDAYTAEKQCLNIYSVIEKNTSYMPSVSIIVPFYNHASFAQERADSIFQQNTKDVEIIFLDDASTDLTREVLRPYCSDNRVSTFFNTVNSGSVFSQWKLGVNKAKSDVVWIAEGDDACNSDVIEILLEEMDDPLVNIASCRTEIINEHSEHIAEGLRPYLDRAYPKKFDSSYKRDGHIEVNENLGAMCTLVNASGLLLRKSSIVNSLDDASAFQMCGDWFVYLSALRRGKIAYRHDAVNLFRRHSSSIVNKVEGTEQYFSERFRIAEYVAEHFHCERSLLGRILAAIDHEWERFSHKNRGKELTQLFDKRRIIDLANTDKECIHIGFYVHGMLLSKGGIERLAAELSNELVSRGHEVTIYCRVWGNTTPMYPTFDSVKVVPCFDENDLERTVEDLKYRLREDSIDVFIPMLSEQLFEPIVSAADDTGIPVIVSEHNDPEKIVELWWDAERRVSTFSKADGIHLLLNKFKPSLPEQIQDRIQVIPNFVSPRPYEAESVVRDDVIIGVGRLSDQKRFDRLIDAFALIADQFPTWSVQIYGEGDLEPELRSTIESYNLSDRVLLRGQVSNIEQYYRTASIFAMPSEFEAFPLVIFEAQQSGLPCVAYRTCNGPNELIDHEVTGLLVDDANRIVGLADALKQLMSDECKRKQFGENAVDNVQHYHIESVCDQWEQFALEHIRSRLAG